MEKQRDFGITAAVLHILAMALMLGDHMWATLFPAAEWLTCIGRAAFPIFAFMIAEGYYHTRDLRRYMLRLLAGAIVSELPFNLVCGGSILYPFHQNVMWTFLISLALITLVERVRHRFRPLPAFAASAGLVLLGFLLGFASMSDYFGPGVLTVFVFYFFREKNWKNFLCQLFCLYIINVDMLGGYYYPVSIGGVELEIVQQGFALAALIPIWLYQGRQGPHSRAFQYLCYAFYPAHMVILFMVREWLMR